MKAKKMLSVAALAMVAGSAHSINLIANGGFETGLGAPGGGFVTKNGGSTDIAGWTVLGHSVDWIGGYWQPSEGARSLDLNGNGQGGVGQSVSTLIGQTYLVSFDLAGNPDGGPTAKLTLVSASGVTLSSQQFTSFAGTKANMGWTTFNFWFTADSASTTLRFESNVTGSFGPALDNVSLAAVPGPAAALPMVAGLLGLRRRRRR